MRRRFFLSGLAASFSVAASDRVRVAAIGIRGQGGRVAASLASMPDVDVVSLCDADQKTFPDIAKLIAARNGGQAPSFQQDLRRVLEDKSIDAVVIGTPDHWHAPATILACAAGKDVYCEKPCSHNLREGRLMIEAARRQRRIVQIGIQSRSRPSTQKAIALAQSGKIGRILMAKAWDVQLRDHIGHREDSPIPAGVDFDLWTGPALALPFNENRFHYKWHWHWNYGTGDMGNDGVHQLDICRWALGVDRPVAVSGMASKLFFEDDQQTPDTMNISYDFGSKIIQFEMRIWNPYQMASIDNGVALYGSDGMIEIGRWNRVWGYKTYDAKGAMVRELSALEDAPENHHHRNFIDYIKSRQSPNAEVEIGHHSTTLCHLGNIVARTGRNLRFDAKTESIAGDRQASALLTRPYRKHWSVPEGA